MPPVLKTDSSLDQVVPEEWSTVRKRNRLYVKDLKNDFCTTSRNKKFKIDFPAQNMTPKNVKWEPFPASFENQFCTKTNFKKNKETLPHIATLNSPPVCQMSDKKARSVPKSANNDWIYEFQPSEEPEISPYPSPSNYNTKKSQEDRNTRNRSLFNQQVPAGRKLTACARELFQDITFSISTNKSPVHHVPILPCKSPPKIQQNSIESSKLYTKHVWKHSLRNSYHDASISCKSPQQNTNERSTSKMSIPTNISKCNSNKNGNNFSSACNVSISSSNSPEKIVGENGTVVSIIDTKHLSKISTRNSLFLDASPEKKVQQKINIVPTLESSHWSIQRQNSKHFSGNSLYSVMTISPCPSPEQPAQKNTNKIKNTLHNSRKLSKCFSEGSKRNFNPKYNFSITPSRSPKQTASSATKVSLIPKCTSDVKKKNSSYNYNSSLQTCNIQQNPEFRTPIKKQIKKCSPEERNPFSFNFDSFFLHGKNISITNDISIGTDDSLSPKAKIQNPNFPSESLSIQSTLDLNIAKLLSPAKSDFPKGTGWLGGIRWQPKTPSKSSTKQNPPDSCKKRKSYLSSGFAQQLKKLELREQASLNLERHKAKSLKNEAFHHLKVTGTNFALGALPLAYCTDTSTQEELILVLPVEQVPNVKAGATLTVAKLGQKTIINSRITMICAPEKVEVTNTEYSRKSSRLLYKWQCLCQHCRDVNHTFKE